MAKQQVAPFGTRQLALALAISLAVIWGIAFYELDRARTARMQEVEHAAELQAQTFAESRLSIIKRLNELLLDLRAYWEDRSVNFSELIRRRQEYLSDITFQVAIIDRDGYLAYSSLGSTTKTYLGDREHFKVHRDGSGDRLFISKPVKGKVSGKWSIQFTRPLLGRQGFDGVLVLSVSPESLVAFGNKLHLGAGAISTIVAADGQMLGREPDNESAMGKTITGVPYVGPGAPLSGYFSGLGQVDGVERIYGFYRVPDYRLSFVVGHAVDEVLVPYYEHRRVVVISAAAVSALIGILIIFAFRSLAARAEAERQLRESQAMLSSAVDTIGEAFTIFDQNDVLVYCNEQYRRYYATSADLRVPGRGFEEIVCQSVARGQYRQAVDDVDQWLAERLAAHRSGDCEFIERLDSGRWLRVRERRTPEGLAVGFHIDITELVEARNAAEQANRAKSQFLATMSHEIRTPMNGILGMAQLLLMSSCSDQERCEFARTIVNSGQTLLALLNDVLDLSKVEAGKLDLVMAVFDPRQMVTESTAVFAEQARSKGLSLAASWRGPAGQRYRADPLRLRQMINNLVSNAIKFTAAGFVRLEANEVERDDGHVLLEFAVTDSGIGIAAEKESRLFKPFSQADSSTTREYGGTGLGLSIVYMLARLMGGDVGVDSELGRGSRFWFRIRAELVAAGEESRGTARSDAASPASAMAARRRQ